MPGSTNSAACVRTQSEPALPPPLFSRGAFAWARANLFSSLVLVAADDPDARAGALVARRR